MHITMELKELKNKLKGARSREEQISLLDSHAEKLFEKGRFADASKVFKQAHELATQPNVRAYFAGQMGICSYNAGRDKEA